MEVGATVDMTSTRPYLRYLRIAFSCMCGMAAVLLVVLWVRSMHTRDLASFGSVIAASTKGRLVFYTLPNGRGPWQLKDFPSYAAVTKTKLGQPFAFGTVPAGPYVTIPYWLLVLVSGATAIFLGLRPPYRFSLRTLLIAFTLVGLILGLIIATTR